MSLEHLSDWPLGNVIALTSYGHYPSKQQELDSLFNRLLTTTTKRTSKLHVAGNLRGESADDRWIPMEDVQHVRLVVFQHNKSLKIYYQPLWLGGPSSSQRLVLQGKWMLVQRYIAVMSHGRHCVWKSLAVRLLVQHLFYANDKEIIQALHYWLFVSWIHRWPVEGIVPVTGGFPSQRVSNGGRVSMVCLLIFFFF